MIEEEYLELVDALFPGLGDVFQRRLPTPVSELRMNEVDFDDFTKDRWTYAPDLVAVADAVADLDVVVNGAGIRHGFDMQALSREVFDSNMSKLGADGKPMYREDGKILKGPDFREPDIAGVLGIEVSA